VKLLALDLATACGWAVFDAGERVASGTWKLKASPGRSRFGHLLLLLRSRVATGVSVVAYEHVHRHVGIDAAHVFGGWLAQLEELVALTGVRLVPITTSQIHAVAKVKRARSPKVAGQTKAEKARAAKLRRDKNKAATIAAACARGWPVEDDNEAEACFCGLVALTQRAGL